MSDKTDAVETTRQTYDLIASDYSSKIDSLVAGSWIGDFERELLDRFLLMLSPGPNILDIGCGNGKDTHYFRQKGAAPVGIDISSGMLAEANKRVPDGILCQMDMRNLGFSDGDFDGVWANGCIYHVPKTDLDGVLEEVLRVLRPSGVFSFNLKVGVGQKLKKTPRSFDRGPRFYAYYSIKEIKRYLGQAGFQIIEVRKYPQRIFDEEIIHLWAHKPVMA